MRPGTYFIAIIPALFFFFTACSSDKSKDRFQFYYYPDKNVYYDPLEKQFLYSLNGAKNWVAFADSTDTASVALGKKVLISADKEKVYEDNEKHRKLYDGRLYNVPIGDTATAAVSPEVVERKVTAKRPVTPGKRSTGKKSGNSIGKFLNKIFGKGK